MKIQPVGNSDRFGRRAIDIISHGYRIKSSVATNFQRWATERLKAEQEYRKYQVETLSPVEEAYLETIRETEKLAKGKARECVWMERKNNIAARLLDAKIFQIKIMQILR